MTRWMPVAFLLLSATPALAGAAPQKAPASTVWREECAACHVAYPPRLLPAASWQAIMAGLSTHFGTNASLEPVVASQIERFLVANAGMRPMRTADGTPSLRITTTPWFARKHEDVPVVAWKRPQIKSPANCTACHAGADADNFSEDAVRIPR